MNGMTLTDKLSRSAYLFHVAVYRICKHNRKLYETFETYFCEAKKKPWGSITTFCQSQKLLKDVAGETGLVYLLATKMRPPSNSLLFKRKVRSVPYSVKMRLKRGNFFVEVVLKATL